MWFFRRMRRTYNEVVLRKFAKINDILNYCNITRKECSENLIPTVQIEGKMVSENNLVKKRLCEAMTEVKHWWKLKYKIVRKICHLLPEVNEDNRTSHAVIQSNVYFWQNTHNHMSIHLQAAYFQTEICNKKNISRIEDKTFGPPRSKKFSDNKIWQEVVESRDRQYPKRKFAHKTRNI